VADGSSGKGVRAIPPQLDAGLRNLLSEPDVLRVSVFDAHGRVLFSTDDAQSGRELGSDAQLLPVLAGEARSDLVLRGAPSPTEEGGVEPVNVMQTRLPLRSGRSGAVAGVFEMRVDVDHLVRQTEHATSMVFAGALAIMALLYAALLTIVRHASGRIQRQQRAVAERTAALAALAGQMLKGEDARRREMAFELHEGVAQTLVAAKLQAEAGHANPDAARASSGAIVPLLRDAIEEVRAIASDLRPASLDELGLLPTLQSLLRELERRYPGVQVASRIAVQEADVRRSLKGIIYRIASGVLGAMTQQGNRGVRMCLRLEEGELVLRIRGPGDQTSSFMEQLTTLSGGAFSAQPDADGGTVLRAAWNSDPTTPGGLSELRP
jgi:hypothetical protein